MDANADACRSSAWVERPAEIDLNLFRQVMSRFASGVAVITTQVGEEVHGMTANAFMSGSLRPPLIVVSVARSAKLNHFLRVSGGFGVSILGSAQESYSKHFAGLKQASLSPSFQYRFGGLPVLSDALATIAAHVQAIHDCGDHSLFVGRICHLYSKDGQPLLYFTGKYKTLI